MGTNKTRFEAIASCGGLRRSIMDTHELVEPLIRRRASESVASIEPRS